MLDYTSKSMHDNPSIRESFDVAYGMFREKKDPDAAKAILRKNAEAGCTASMVLLGYMLSDGTDEERKESLALFRRAAYMNDSSGLRNLAYCYATGRNCEKDSTLGIQFYIKSAELGNAKAACNAGVMYDYGNGVDKDPYSAFMWYLRSAEGGCQRGMTNLGEDYLWGCGTEKDVDKAEEWLLKSGSPRALYRLAEIYHGEKDHINEKKGMDCLIKSADGGYSRALYRYGMILEKDDFSKAVELFSKAARKGNKDAASKLALLNIPVPESAMSRRRNNKDSANKNS